MNTPAFCTIEAISGQDCAGWLAWVRGRGEAPSTAGTPKWLLAHCDDGVTWGRFDSAGAGWRLSSQLFPDLSPDISETNLLEMRFFDDSSEVLIWRTDSGFQGRRLADSGKGGSDKDDPLWPASETRVLLGDRVLKPSIDGFTLVGDGTGSRQAVPRVCLESDFTCGRWPLRLGVRHYFETDADTGAVRVCAARLVGLSMEGR